MEVSWEDMEEPVEAMEGEEQESIEQEVAEKSVEKPKKKRELSAVEISRMTRIISARGQRKNPALKHCLVMSLRLK